MGTWEEATLDKLGILKSGRQTHKPEYDENLFCEGNVPLIESQLMEDGHLFFEKIRRYYNNLGVRQSKIFESGTVCITRTRNVVKILIIKDTSCLSSIEFMALHHLKTFQILSLLNILLISQK